MSNKSAQPGWAINTDKTLQGIEEGLKISKSSNQPDWVKQGEESSYEMARMKYSGEAKAYEKVAGTGHLMIEKLVHLPFAESAGLYLSKFFTAIKDEDKILANRCHRCERVIFPPRVVCGFCRVRIEDIDENWLELSDRGTVVSYSLVVEREVDRATGKIVGDPYACAFIRLDGGDQWSIIAHFLEERDLAKLPNVKRVQAVWRPKEERRARMSDIKYFRTIGD